MVYKKECITNSVFIAIDNYNSFQTKELQLEKNLKTVLFSRTGFTKTGKLDSLGLVNLLVLIEEKINEECNISFSLPIHEIIEDKENLLKDLESLINYLNKQINKN